MKTLLSTLALILALIASPINAYEFPPIDTITASTHHLIAENHGQELSRCTTEFVSAKYLVTAGHCINPDATGYVVDLNKTMVFVSLVTVNKANDVAVFKLDEGTNDKFVKMPDQWFASYLEPLLVVCYNGGDSFFAISTPVYLSEADNLTVQDNPVKVRGAAIHGGDLDHGCSGGGVYAIQDDTWVLIGTTIAIAESRDPANPSHLSFISRLTSLKDITQFVLR